MCRTALMIMLFVAEFEFVNKLSLDLSIFLKGGKLR